MEHFEKSLQIRLEINGEKENILELAYLLNSISIVFYRLGNLEKALENS